MTRHVAGPVSQAEGDAIAAAVLELVRRIQTKHLLAPLVAALPPGRHKPRPTPSKFCRTPSPSMQGEPPNERF